ncbi:MAG: serine/threonine-protein kinase [Polyangiaceae bacterium]
MFLARGAVVDRYVLIEHVGGGGQGEVWKVADRTTGALSALKVVTLSTDERRNERTRREARALARLDHPSLVRARALFEDGRLGLIGVALDWIDGPSLASSKPRVDARQARFVVLHLARVLGHLHTRGIVHRDVKPANVLLESGFFADPTRPDAVKLVDFGIATAIGNPGGLTDTGVAIGTLPYMAPEILDAAHWPAPSAAPGVDVFALGVVAHELLFATHPTGRAFGAPAMEFVRAYRDAGGRGASWPSALAGASGFVAVVRDCLALDATARFPTCAEVAAAMERVDL